VILCPCRKRRNLYRSDGRRTRWPPRGLDTSRGGLFRLLGIGRAMSWFSSSGGLKKLATGGFYSIQFGRTLPPASLARVEPVFREWYWGRGRAEAAIESREEGSHGVFVKSRSAGSARLSRYRVMTIALMSSY
jgi:hypothetical protein